MSNYSSIRDAITNKHQVWATYKGHHRKMCPHVIGTKNGKNQALFYQFGGTSSSGPIIPGSRDNWRCIPVDQLSDIQVVPGDWFTASNHSTPSTCVDTIDVEVDY